MSRTESSESNALEAICTGVEWLQAISEAIQAVVDELEPVITAVNLAFIEAQPAITEALEVRELANSLAPNDDLRASDFWFLEMSRRRALDGRFGAAARIAYWGTPPLQREEIESSPEQVQVRVAAELLLSPWQTTRAASPIKWLASKALVDRPRARLVPPRLMEDVPTESDPGRQLDWQHVLERLTDGERSVVQARLDGVPRSRLSSADQSTWRSMVRKYQWFSDASAWPASDRQG